MKKLIIILAAILVVFTFIGAYTGSEVGLASPTGTVAEIKN